MRKIAINILRDEQSNRLVSFEVCIGINPFLVVKYLKMKIVLIYMRLYGCFKSKRASIFIE